MKKGMTLVEVLVALFVASVAFAATLSVYIAISKASQSQKDYTYFESICIDIDKVYDDNGQGWDLLYYGSHQASAVIYYDSYYHVCSESDARYSLKYSYDTSGYLVINISNLKTGKVIIRDLNYGVAKNV